MVVLQKNFGGRGVSQGIPGYSPAEVKSWKELLSELLAFLDG